MASASAPLPARVTAVAADVIDGEGLGARAVEIAARQRSPQTRRTYAAVYRSLLGFLGEHATVEDLTPGAVRAYRDALEQHRDSLFTRASHPGERISGYMLSYLSRMRQSRPSYTSGSKLATMT